MTSTSLQEKTTSRHNRTAPTRTCRDCRLRKAVEDFPLDRFNRANTRMCLQCVDENAPQLMTETEAAKWFGVTVAEVRTWPMAGDYSPAGKAPIPLYSRPAVGPDHLPAGWRSVFEWMP